MTSYRAFRSEAARQTYLSFYDQRARRWPVPSDSVLVPTSFGRTFVRIQGPETGPPVILLPGDSETSLSWSPVIGPLSEGFRTYAVDHVNDLGRSECVRPPRVPDDFTRWLEELFTGLDVRRAHLIGHSYGGWQAARLALAHPELLDRLVLLAPAATVLRPSLTLLARAILYELVPIRPMTRDYLYWYASESVRDERTRPAVDAMVEEILLARRCLTRRRFVIPTVLTDSEWSELRVPTLFMVGESDVTYPARAAAERLAARAPAVRTVVVNNADHHLCIVSPQLVVDRVLGFLGTG